jgi:hypothetical protein
MYKRLVINTLCNYYVPYVPMCFKKNDLFIIYSLLKINHVFAQIQPSNQPKISHS